METLAAIPFQQVLEALVDVNQPLNPRYLYRFSDLDKDELRQLQNAWPRVPEWRRQALMEDLQELGGSNLILSFEALCRFALQDTDPNVRVLAIQMLWDYELDDLIPVYLDLMEVDRAVEVRTAAATALGSYIYLGEIEELPESTLHEIEDRLLKVANGKDVTEVRRHALESLGFSSRDEVAPIIETAFYSGQNEWVASALFAMGRSADEAWEPLVLGMLENEEPSLRLEAARAAGELETRQAVPRLVDLLNDEDVDIRSAAIWSLSQIGGEGVRDILEQMYDESDDEEEAEFIEEALDNLAFTEDMEIFELLDIDEDEDEEQQWEDDEDLYDSLQDDGDPEV